jgi:hypothetical protein
LSRQDLIGERLGFVVYVHAPCHIVARVHYRLRLV